MAEPKKKWVSEYFGNWRFQYQVYDENTTYNGFDVIKGRIPAGGLAIRNVYHDNFRLAYDMRTHGIWVFPGVKVKGTHSAKRLVLGIVDFEQIPVRDNDYHPVKYKKGHKNSQETINPDQGKKFGLPYNFSSFANHTQGELMVKWKSRDKIFGDGSDHLYITQIMAFTGYASSPAHEPSGGVSAARLHPMVKVYYSNRNDGYYGSVRVDYRLHVNLDSYSSRDIALTGGGPRDIEIQISKTQVSGRLNNHAGLFRDADHLQADYPAEGAVFESAEKPIVAEIVGRGLFNGSNVIGSGTHSWDNVHWWGAGGTAHASAPGAFHALHLHWRWGKILHQSNPLLYALGVVHAGEKQFRGLSHGGLLTDPNIANQTIQVAVAIKKEVDSYSKESTENFEDYFDGNPAEINTAPEGGANLVLYYSAEVNRKQPVLGNQVHAVQKGSDLENLIQAPIEGYVFLHGVFFAHEMDQEFSSLVGSHFEHYANPEKEKLVSQINSGEIKWQRNPTV